MRRARFAERWCPHWFLGRWLASENEQRRGLTGAGSLVGSLSPRCSCRRSGFLFGAQMLLVHFSLMRRCSRWILGAFSSSLMPYCSFLLGSPIRSGPLDPLLCGQRGGSGGAPAADLLQREAADGLRATAVRLRAPIGFAVSIALYLPTLFAGAGRIATLTTEAVTLSSGGDRRVIGVYAFIQALLPLAVYAIALALPALIYRQPQGTGMMEWSRCDEAGQTSGVRTGFRGGARFCATFSISNRRRGAAGRARPHRSAGRRGDRDGAERVGENRRCSPMWPVFSRQGLHGARRNVLLDGARITALPVQLSGGWGSFSRMTCSSRI